MTAESNYAISIDWLASFFPPMTRHKLKLITPCARYFSFSTPFELKSKKDVNFKVKRLQAKWTRITSTRGVAIAVRMRPTIAPAVNVRHPMDTLLGFISMISCDRNKPIIIAYMKSNEPALLGLFSFWYTRRSIMVSFMDKLSILLVISNYSVLRGLPELASLFPILSFFPFSTRSQLRIFLSVFSLHFKIKLVGDRSSFVCESFS